MRGNTSHWRQQGEAANLEGEENAKNKDAWEGRHVQCMLDTEVGGAAVSARYYSSSSRASGRDR